MLSVGGLEHIHCLNNEQSMKQDISFTLTTAHLTSLSWASDFNISKLFLEVILTGGWRVN